MDDLISRSKAIQWVKTECNPYGQPTLDYESGIKVIEYLEHMSSAQPVRRGRWIKRSGQWICSECGTCDYYAYAWNSETGEYTMQDLYCPNCGARMEGEE